MPIYNLDEKKFRPYKKAKFYQNKKKLESLYGNDEITRTIIGEHSECHIGIEFESFGETSINDLGKQQISRFVNCLNLLDSKKPHFHI